MNGINSLKSNAVVWVRPEFDTLIARIEEVVAGYTLEGDPPGDVSQQGSMDLIQIEKTLAFLELPGARLLAVELASLLENLDRGQIDDRRRALDVASEALLTLKNYLSHLGLGEVDQPAVLFDLLNEIRGAYGAPPLSEDAVFFPQLHAVSAPAVSHNPAGTIVMDARAVAAKVRIHYEAGLIAWFRGSDEVVGLKKMLAVTARLHLAARYEASRRLWWGSSALLEALLVGAVEPDPGMRSLFGQLDREIKHLIERGEQEFAMSVPDELVRRLLYFVAVATDTGRYVKDVKAAFSLEEALPSKVYREQQRRCIDGRSSEVFASVAEAIRGELSQVRESLEMRLNDVAQNWSVSRPDVEKLERAAETLRMAGAQTLQHRICETVGLLQKWSGEDAAVAEEPLIEVASNLLGVEAELEQATGVSDPGGIDASSAGDRSDGGLSGATTPPSAQILDSVAGLILEEMEKLKDAVLGYISSPDSYIWSADLTDLLSRIRGAVEVLGASEVRNVVTAIGDYLDARAAKVFEEPADAEQIQVLADAVASIQCYAEILKGQGASDLEVVIEAGQESARRLRGFLPDGGADASCHDRCPDGAGLHETSCGSHQVIDLPVANRKPNDETAADSATDRPRDGLDGPSARGPQEGSDNPEVQVPDRYLSLQVLRADADTEILEVFVEEAEEETRSLEASLRAWDESLTDHDALGAIRRSFHTLKGSGRLVGAEFLGEFGWAFESLLNKIIEGGLPPRPSHQDLVRAAKELLPELVQHLETRDSPPEQAYALMVAADAAAQGDEGPAAVWQKKKNYRSIRS